MKKLLLALSLCLLLLSPAYAQVEPVTEKTTKYTLNYPVVTIPNADAQKQINTDIGTLVANFRTAMENGVYIDSQHTDRMQYVNGATNYKLMYEDEELLSLTFTDYRFSGGAHGMHTTYGLVYDKATGARVPLDYFVKITAAQLEQEAAGNLYSLEGQKLEYNWTGSVKRVPQDYFLNGNGGLSLIFTPYELGPYAYGSTTIRLDENRVTYYNQLNGAQ